MNIDINNLKRKPLLDYKTLLNFSRLGLNIGGHPIVIMEYGDDLVFVNAQTAVFNNFSKEKLSDPKLQKKLENNELFLIPSLDNILVPENKRSLFYNDSLVDTTSLFIINKNDFQKVFNLENNKYLEYTRKIDLITYGELLLQIKSNIENNNYSINRINYDKEMRSLKCELLYTNKDLFLNEYNNLSQSIKDFISETYNNLENKTVKYEAHNLLLSLIEEEIDHVSGKQYYIFQRYDPYAYDDLNDEINTKKLFNLSDQECAYEDFLIEVEIESFSDYEKEYYNQHPDEYKAKYKTYLEKLKEAYFEYENKTKSQSSQNKIKECKDLDDDFELER